ncbi:MAG TPA: DnaA regulatory inactivator Hda [Agitococcus sp.]|nr:DnaA regulatory inactivator Hda [Agitococcus sp.]
MKARHSQMVLNLGPRLDARLSDFAGPSWAAIIAAIHDLLTGKWQRCFVYGQPDTGKTHLLAAACEHYTEQGHTTLLLSLRELIRTNNPHCLESLEHYDLIALDDIEMIQGHPDWQEALFHLLNRALEHNTKILLAARAMPTQLGLSLPDLVSRLQQAACFGIPSGEDDADREALLLAALGRRNLNLDPEIIRYLLVKGPRYTGLLLKHLSFLEESSLQQRKKLTLNFVKQLTERF